MEQLKRLSTLWCYLTTHTQLSQYVEEPDRALFLRRVEGEGYSFLTVVLPRLYKALDASFASGKLEPVVGFTAERGCAYPRFLRKAWCEIFNKDGSLKFISEVDVGAVKCIRQLSAIFYKLELPATKAQEEEVAEAFIRADADLNRPDLITLSESVLTRARGLVCRLLEGVNPLEITPRHGSGASSCGVLPHERYESFRYIRRLAEVYPYDEYFFANLTHVTDESQKLWEAKEDEPLAKVCFVPKDSRGPRLISCEPREFMYVQQGLMALMYRTVQKYPAIADQIGFTDQSRNQRLARLGSMDQSYATLDLKEASDRVSLELVEKLFPNNWFRALAASRSLGTVLPDGRIVRFHKFAPMGSACCFPVEAICFWSIAIATACGPAYVKTLFRRSFTEIEAKMLRKKRFSVFGDDIIVPTEFAPQVIESLHKCGLLVNTSKSFLTGPFRESCGGDFFNGVDVAPIRCKKLMGDDKVSWFRTAELFNNLAFRFGDNLREALRDFYEELYGPVPESTRYRIQDGALVKTHAGLSLWSRYTHVPLRYRRRFSQTSDGQKPNYCRTEYRIPVELPVVHKHDQDRWSMILRKWCENHDGEMPDTHALAKRVRIKYSWTPL